MQVKAIVMGFLLRFTVQRFGNKSSNGISHPLLKLQLLQVTNQTFCIRIKKHRIGGLHLFYGEGQQKKGV